MDQVALQKRSTAGTIFVKAPSLVGLSVAGLITNTGAAATESLNLLGKLALAGVKYGAMKPIQLFIGNDSFEATMAKMPNGKSLAATAKKVAAYILGIIYSAIGLVAPTFNLRRQEQIGNFVNQRKVAEANQALAAQKALGAQRSLDAQQADEAKKAEEVRRAAEDLDQARIPVRKNGKIVAVHAAAAARGEFEAGKAFVAQKEARLEHKANFAKTLQLLDSEKRVEEIQNLEAEADKVLKLEDEAYILPNDREQHTLTDIAEFAAAARRFRKITPESFAEIEANRAGKFEAVKKNALPDLLEKKLIKQNGLVASAPAPAVAAPARGLFGRVASVFGY